jgi:pimeloyl-ACP methyl ester carboxylesterase
MVEGATLCARTWGLDRSDLPGLLLVAGFGAHAAWWDHVGPRFTDRFRVAALDLSGMGDSGRRKAYSYAQHAREMLATLDILGFERASIVGHSYGGTTTLIACRLGPERIGRAVIVDTAILLPEQPDNVHPAYKRRLYPTREAALARFRLVPPGGWPDPDIFAYIAEHSVCEGPDGWTWKIDPMMSDSLNAESYRHLHRDIAVPLHFIHGECSEIVGPELVHRIPGLFPTSLSRSVGVPLSHHHIMIEQPVAFVATLGALLSSGRAPE